jgi:hypothetical protein
VTARNWWKPLGVPPGLTTGRTLEGARFLTSLPRFAAERTKDGVTDRTWSARIEGRPRLSGRDEDKASCQDHVVGRPRPDVTRNWSLTADGLIEGLGVAEAGRAAGPRRGARGGRGWRG